MTNGNNEWNRWRGEQSAILRLMKEEMEDNNKRLDNISKELYIIKGKATVFGAFAGIVASLITSLIVSLI